jgi:hypothetical protein
LRFDLGGGRRDEARYSPPNPAFKTWNNCPPNFTVQDGLVQAVHRAKTLGRPAALTQSTNQARRRSRKRPDPPVEPNGPGLATTHRAAGHGQTNLSKERGSLLHHSWSHFIYSACCSVPYRPGSSRRAFPQRPTSCPPATCGCMRSSTMASASSPARSARG